MQLNGDFSWRNFFLGFITRKFVLAVTLQAIATYFAYDALATLNAAALLSGKAAAQYAPQIVVTRNPAGLMNVYINDVLALTGAALVYTSSKYIILDLDAGDKIALSGDFGIKKYLGVV